MSVIPRPGGHGYTDLPDRDTKIDGRARTHSCFLQGSRKAVEATSNMSKASDGWLPRSAGRSPIRARKGNLDRRAWVAHLAARPD